MKERSESMPLLQKPSPPPGRTDLAQTTYGYQAASAPAHPVTSRPLSAAQRRREARYDRIVRVGATAVGFAGCVLGWLFGSYFTLSWLETLGIGFATTALAPIRALLQHGQVEHLLAWTTFSESWLTIIGAWAIPLGITLAEIGFDPQRVGGRTSRLLWGVFLCVDAITTGLGIQPVISRFAGESVAAWALAGVVGLLLALVPEKVARRLILENLN
jgi:hypothetical protein